MFGIPASRFRVLLGTMEQRPKVVRDIASTGVVLHNILRTYQSRIQRAPNPADDIAAITNEATVDDENHGIPLREAKHQ